MYWPDPFKFIQMKVVFFGFLFFWAMSGFSQVTTIIRNPEIQEMTAQVSSDSLAYYLEGLVAYGTRHSLSEETENRGIEAARKYVLAKFKSFESQSRGRLSSNIDYFPVYTDGKRVNREVKMGNVMATLKGSNPNDDRVFVVSGAY